MKLEQARQWAERWANEIEDLGVARVIGTFQALPKSFDDLVAHHMRTAQGLIDALTDLYRDEHLDVKPHLLRPLIKAV